MAKLRDVYVRCRACGARSVNLLTCTDANEDAYLAGFGWARMSVQLHRGWLCAECACEPDTASVLVALRDGAPWRSW